MTMRLTQNFKKCFTTGDHKLGLTGGTEDFVASICARLTVALGVGYLTDLEELRKELITQIDLLVLDTLDEFCIEISIGDTEIDCEGYVELGTINIVTRIQR